MKRLTVCPSCGGRSFRPYSFTPEGERTKSLHYSQSHCTQCDLVFSDPVAEPAELEAFYNSVYYEEIENVYHARRPDLKTLVQKRVEETARGLSGMVLPYVPSGVFFEIGTGHGAVLEAARRLGFDVAGVEPSQSAAIFGQEVLGLSKLRHGIFCAGDWPEAFCDVVYSHHVIEHVPDLNGFLQGINRILKPGGLVVVGTENHRNSWVPYRKVRSWLKGRWLPEFQTADHHTFYFSDRSLCYALEHAGFEILKVLVYSPSLEDKLAVSRFRSIFSKAFFYWLHYSEVWSGRGNRLLVWCRKPASRIKHQAACETDP